MSETGGEFGVALGIATLGSLATAASRDRIADAIPPDVPAGAARIAREGIAAAISTADRLPDCPAAELLVVAREAFTAGLNAAAGVGAVLFLSLAVLATILLGHVRPYEEEADETEAAPVAVESSLQP